MGVDLRQVVAGVLTVTMFVMLGQMIKRDHLDFVEDQLPDQLPGIPNIDNEAKGTKPRLVTLNKRSNGLWVEDSKELKQCWTNSDQDDEMEVPKGFVTFSLTNGPEYHVSQVADAVVVARRLGATLVLPDIRGSKPGDKRNFGEIYDVKQFVKNLDGVVRVVKKQPSEIPIQSLTVTKVPNRVTEDHIVANIEPVFRKNGHIRLVTFFPSVNMKKSENGDAGSVACLGMFGTLKLQMKVHDVVDSMVERLRTLGRKSNGQFIAVDLRVDMLEEKGCQGIGAKKSCYAAEEIAVFLRKLGFLKDTTIYLTQSRWDSSLDALKNYFPKTYTKESILPANSKSRFLDSGWSELEKVMDFYICSESDIFVPAISGLFYANVAGKRIASGKSQILVPGDISGSSASPAEFISPYVSNKNHLAYSCFC